MTTLPIAPDADVLSWSCIHARGDDAVSFLQGQLSQDVTGLDTDRWSLVLTPDSVVVAPCVVRRGEGGLDLVMQHEVVDDVLRRLRRFVLRARCTLECVRGARGPFATDDDRIDAAWPGVAEMAAALTPHSFGREFVAATVSFDKGCFTGQELVGRLDARGASVPWRLVRVRAPDLESADTVLRSAGPPGPAGVTSARRAGRSNDFQGLGVAHRTLLGGLGRLERDDVVVDEVP